LLISGVTVATTDTKTKVPWRFWASLSGVIACEVVTLLVGFHILPHRIWHGSFDLSSIFLIPALFFGQAVEMRMQIIRGVPASTDEESWAVFRRSTIFGMMYFVPVFAAAVGRLVPWLLVVSVVTFLGLMIRIWWLSTKRTASSI